MKMLSVFLSAVVILFTAGSVANATLIDTTVKVQRHAPSLWTVDETHDVTVQAGTGDEQGINYHWYTPSDIRYSFYVDMEADSILVDQRDYEGVSFSDNSSISFNGLVVDQLNDTSGYPLIGVSVSTSVADWDSSRLSFGNDWVAFDWKALVFDQGASFDATLNFGQPIPEPATVLLLGTGLVGLAGFRKKFKK